MFDQLEHCHHTHSSAKTGYDEVGCSVFDDARRVDRASKSGSCCSGSGILEWGAVIRCSGGLLGVAHCDSATEGIVGFRQVDGLAEEGVAELNLN